MAALPPTHGQLAGGTRGRDRAADRRYDESRRGDVARRVRSSARWQKVRALKLARDPLCEACMAAGRTVAAREVDHVVAIRAAPHLAFAMSNLASLCVPCHRRKEARARGG